MTFDDVRARNLVLPERNCPRSERRGYSGG